MRTCSYLPPEEEDVANVCVYSFIYYSCTLQHTTLTSAYCDDVKLKARFAFTTTKLFFFFWFKKSFVKIWFYIQEEFAVQP